MRKLFWSLVVVGSFAGGLFFVFGMMGASSAPQQAATAGISLTLAVVPYCAARAIDEIGKKE